MRPAILTALWVCAALVVGCSYADFEKPYFRNYVADYFGGWERPEEVEGSDYAEVRALAAAIEKWQESSAFEEGEYRIGAGDELEISISVPTSLESIATVTQRVTARGEISTPLIGQVQVVGTTIDGLQRKLVQMYADGYLKSPIVGVAVKKYASKRYMVTGAVMKPGIYGLEENRTTVIEAVLAAGGVLPEAGEYAVITRRRTLGEETQVQTVRVNIDAMLRRGAFDQNVWVGPGDVVHVPPETNPKKFYVLGFANTQGSFPLPRDRKFYILDAVAEARGISPVARPDMTELIRVTPTGKKRYPVDLTKVVRGEIQDIPLAPGDVLRIRTSWWRRHLEGLRYMFGLAGSVPTAAP